MYPLPYFDAQAWRRFRQDILANGFQPDPILTADPDRPVYGLNLAFGWPLPTPCKKPYEKLALELRRIAPCAYVYPYWETHVTVMTLINFKKHQQPSEDALADLQPTVKGIVSAAPQLLEGLRIRPFAIDIGPPVLSPSAAFLPILNPTGEVERIRLEGAKPEFRRQIAGLVAADELIIPNIIHSTILRFTGTPTDTQSFVETFEQVAADNEIGEVIVDEILLTAETKPYMRDGEVLHRFKLREGS